jgi:Xaa-Pro aminopeptidase
MSEPQRPDQSLPAVFAGVPSTNLALYHRIRFAAGDPAALLDMGEGKRHLLIRDIEVDRARRQARADRVSCPADHAPRGGLSGDREIATAQAFAELCRSAGVDRVRADRSLPLSFAFELGEAGVRVEYDPLLGVLERRAKDAQEIEHLRTAQRDTEGVVRRVCEVIAGAEAGSGGVLRWNGPGPGGDGGSGALMSERLFAFIDLELLRLGYDNPAPSIVACGVEGGDCHNRGSGELRTGEPVIIDVFPRSKESGYHGDCTRTVVHGEVDPRLVEMHAAVLRAKRLAIEEVRPGATGDAVHRAAAAEIERSGFAMGRTEAGGGGRGAGLATMPHGTGHGVGLEVHEPPLLDVNGPELVRGDCLTIEPGLYMPSMGGVRVEDMVIVTADGCENLNSIPEGLCWA